MADQFTLAQSVNYVRETPPETSRMIPDLSYVLIPEDNSSGSLTISANTTDQLVASQVNTFLLYTDVQTTSISLKLGNTTNTAMTGISVFTYSGDKTNVYITNSTSNAVKVFYATCTLA